MERSHNRIILLGRVGEAPESRQTDDNETVTVFDIAVQLTWTDQDGNTSSKEDWFKAVTWNELASLAADKLSVDDHVFIEGQLQTRSWQDGDGTSYFRTEILVEHLVIVDDLNNFDASDYS